MNQNQLWYCDICYRRINFRRKSKHINTKSHKHKEKYCTIVKEYEFVAPDIDQVNYILNDTIKDFRSKYFHSFEY